MLALFKSHFSIGKSILTLDDPKKTSDGGPDSVFAIAKEEGLNKVILVEDTLIGFFEAYKRSKELNIDLLFGLRLSMRNSSLEDDKASQHKVIIFAKNAEGCKVLNKLYSKAFCEFDGFLDYPSLRDSWNEAHLRLVVPFYDSFLYVNSFTFGNCLPDFSFCSPTFLIEKNNVSIDHLLACKVEQFAANKYPIFSAKSIYYRQKTDVSAFQTYKILCNRSVGKERNLNKPELPHFCSNEFCFESWKENAC